MTMHPDARAIARSVWPLAVLVTLSIPWILFRLGSYSLINGDEGLYQSVAAQMLESGNWLRLEFKGQHRVYDTFMNAPIQYWAKASLIWVFGDNYWTMRILSALFGVASVLATYRLVHLLAGRSSAFAAALVQLTTLQFVYLHSARTGELETLVTFLFTLTAYYFLRAMEDRSRFLAHTLCLAVLINVKLPLAVLPLLAELLCFALIPGTRSRFRAWMLAGVSILPFAFAWHLFQMIELWRPFQYVLHSMSVHAAGSDLTGAGSGPLPNLLFYGKTLLFGAFPYALAYPLAIFGVLRERRSPVDRSRWIVIGLYLFVILGFFVLVGRHQRWYIMPAYPFFSAFVGAWLARLCGMSLRWPHFAALGLLGSLMIWMGVAATHFNPFAEQADQIWMDFAWRRFVDIGPGLGAPLLAVALAVGLAALRRPLGERLPRVVAYTLALALIGYGAVRVSSPLAHLGYQTPLEQLRRNLEASREAGLPIDFPIRVEEACCLRAQYYFADEFEIVPVRRRGRVNFWLYEKNDPRAARPTLPNSGAKTR